MRLTPLGEVVMGAVVLAGLLAAFYVTLWVFA